MADMALDGGELNAEYRADLGVALICREQPQNLKFGFGKPLDRLSGGLLIIGIAHSLRADGRCQLL